MSEKKSYDPDSSEAKELLEVNIVDEMSEVLRAIDGKISPEIMEKLDWSIRAIQVRLSIVEGNVSILHQSHLSHTNTDFVEFKNMHGFTPGTAQKKEQPLGSDSTIGRAITLTSTLIDLIQELREYEDETTYYAVEAMVALIVKAAGLEGAK
ncbi:MAG: hypothetical protein KGD60_13820 [Candidatus Thorarchaeota archaeon]|nr:hypothetical protein [Candidatus Thorarchaeota archaeon]